MNYSKNGYKIACWSFILVGTGHIFTDLFGPKTPDQNEFIQTMKDFTIQLAGTETSIFSLHQGFSLTMGALLIAYGLLNLLILRNNHPTSPATNILMLNILISVACVVLSALFFFTVPIVLTSLACLGFIVSFLTRTT